MEILSKLPKQLEELMFDKGIKAPALAEQVNVKSNAITRYLRGVHLPTFEIFIALVDFFHCSADFLLGLSDDPQYGQTYLPAPPFRESFRAALDKYNISQYALQKKTDISWANFHHWLKGTRLPYPDSLVRLAVAIDCTVDDLLGRTK